MDNDEYVIMMMYTRETSLHVFKTNVFTIMLDQSKGVCKFMRKSERERKRTHNKTRAKNTGGENNV